MLTPKEKTAPGGAAYRSGLPLQQVVEATGFADLSHFHRVFEKHFGCNPTRYREQSREAPPLGVQTAMGRHQRFTSRATVYGSAIPILLKSDASRQGHEEGAAARAGATAPRPSSPGHSTASACRVARSVPELI